MNLNLEKVHDREVLLFLNMCKKEDGNFLNLPLKKRKIEDAVRLLCITTALSLRGPFFSVINAEEKRFDELISHWERIRYDEEKVTAWLDDFIAAAEYLIAGKYTSTDKLAIHGGSNGGLLVGACEVQRPDLYAVCLPAVGVMDMLRYHKFTIGWGWAVEYGSSEDEEQFSYIYKYSPLHNIKEGVKYPATLVTTADHDDRVVPAHSFKFAAAMQHAQAGDAPILIRIESKAGHGAGKPTSKRIDEAADMYAFLFQNIGVPYKVIKLSLIHI